MIYQIIHNPQYTNVSKVGINITPDNDPLKFLLTTVKFRNYPQFITETAKSSSLGGYEFVHFWFFGDADWEVQLWVKNFSGRKLEEGEVFIVHNVMGEAIIDEQIFDNIVYDFASELLEVYANDKQLPSEWSDEMKIALEKLRNKIETHNHSC